MWLEARKSLGRFRVTFLTSLQAVIRMHGRLRIIDPLDGVASVAVKTLGRVGVAQPVDLAVVGFRVGLQALGMAVSAVPGNDDLGRIFRGVLDVMGGVAIGTDEIGRASCRERV